MLPELRAQIYETIQSEPDRVLALLGNHPVDTALQQQGYMKNDTPLFWAIKFRQYKLVISLLVIKKANSNIIVCDHNSEAHSLLYFASSFFYANNKDDQHFGEQCINLLIKNGAAPYEILFHSNTLFHMFASSPTLQKLSSDFASKNIPTICINKTNDVGKTPLLLAIQSRNYQLMTWLLTKNADPNTILPGNYKVIDLVVLSYELRYISTLVEHGAELTPISLDENYCIQLGISPTLAEKSPRKLYYPLQMAVLLNKDIAVIRYLAEHSSNLPKDNIISLLSHVIMGNSLDKLGVLMEFYKHLLTDDDYIVLSNLSFDDTDKFPITKYLTELIKLNCQTETVMTHYRRICSLKDKGHKSLLQSIIQIDTIEIATLSDAFNKARLLLRAITNQEIKVILAHVNGINLNLHIPDFYNFTCFSYALYIEGKKIPNKQIIEILLKHGANPNKACQGYTPLAYVVGLVAKQEPALGYSIAQLLLQYGADPNLHEREAQLTALQIAVDYNHLGLARLLMEHGADPNRLSTKSHEVLTKHKQANVNATYIAISRGHNDILRCLLEYPRTKMALSAEDGRCVYLKLLVDLSEYVFDKMTLLFSHLMKSQGLDLPDNVIEELLGINTFGTRIKNPKRMVQLETLRIVTEKAASLDEIFLDHNIYYAIICCDSNVLQILTNKINYSHFTKYNGDSAFKFTPLLFAILCTNYQAIEWIIENSDFDANNPLHPIDNTFHGRCLDFACRFQDARMISLLIRLGANLDIASIFRPNLTYREIILSSPVSICPVLPDSQAQLTSKQPSPSGSEGHTISAHKFVQNLQIAHNLKSATFTPASTSPALFFGAPPPISFSWFDGKLNSKQRDIIAIENHPYYFLYFDDATLIEGGCQEELLSQFKRRRMRFDETHIKHLTGEITEKPFKLISDGNSYSAHCRYELKIKSSPARILLFELDHDIQKTRLLIGALYAANGLHELSNIKSLLSRSDQIIIHLRNSDEIASHKVSQKMASSNFK